MKKRKKIEEHLEYILRKMCTYVGAKYEDIDFKKADWYSQYEWTFNARDHFEKWLIDYYYHNPIAFQNRPQRVRKSDAEQAASEFIFNYAWSTASELKEREKIEEEGHKLDLRGIPISKHDLVSFHLPKRMGIGRVINTLPEFHYRIKVMEVDTHEVFEFNCYEMAVIITDMEEKLSVWKNLKKTN